MKRLLTILMLCFIYLASNGQTLTVTLPTITATVGQEVYIPVKLTGASSSGVPISSANLQITYDTAVLTFNALVNFYSGTPESQWFYSGYDGLVSANWLEPGLQSLAIPDNTTLYEIKFTYKGGSSPLIFVVYEFTGPPPSYSVVPTTPVNGAVNAITRQVTFQVDMSKETISPDGVHLAGSFNNWSYSQTVMTVNANNFFIAILNLEENVTYQYRFVNGNTAAGLETVPPGCGVLNGNGEYDRQITVPDHDTIYEPVCFSMCSYCPESVTVTFRVDMQHETISPDGVHVAGTFNNWNYAETPMTLTSGTIYEASMTMDETTYLEFRFANGNTDQQSENVPAGCSVNGNRYFTVPDHDTVMTSFCYDSCFECGTILQYSHVTFRVDMATQTISPDGVHIAGTFQGWNPGTTPMENIIDDIYTYSDSLLANTSVQYKFVNGNTESGYEIVPFNCSSNGDRTLLVPANDTILNLVCFAECDTCNFTGLPEFQSNDLSLAQNFPNPCSDITHIGYKTNRDGYMKLLLFSPIGRLISTLIDGPCVAGSYNLPLKTKDLPSGIYYYQMTFSNQSGIFIQSRKMLVR